LGSGAPLTPAAPPEAPGGFRDYPADRRHAPLTAPVVAGLRATLGASSGRRDVFAKVGDSITVSGHFARCLTGDDVRWGDHAALAATRDFFARTPADDRGHDAFARATQAAAVGWRTHRVVLGLPTPLARELDAVRPAWAVVMLGTNDTYPDAMQAFHHDLRRVLAALQERRVVPLLSTLPPRLDRADRAAQTVEMNAVVRALAAELALPLMDLHGALAPLPHRGLARDGVHPEAFLADRYHPCWFDAAGSQGGMNQRNLLVLEALDRARRLVLGDEPPEPAPPPPAGDGSWASPRSLGPLPAALAGDVARGESRASRYACGRDESPGPEQVFRVEVATAGRVRARLFGGEGLTLRWLTGPAATDCTATARRRLDVVVRPGTHWLAVDSARDAPANPYLLTVVSL
ncbi:MAG: SGNH/GDSL hydrolase family protein, partial [Myxococcales bacterium]